jgi:FAD/FMN-containing dehydrogenase
MNRILTIDRAKKRVLVQAGCMLNELVHALAMVELCLPSLPCLLEQTVAGGIRSGYTACTLINHWYQVRLQL